MNTIAVNNLYSFEINLKYIVRTKKQIMIKMNSGIQPKAPPMHTVVFSNRNM